MKKIILFALISAAFIGCSKNPKVNSQLTPPSQCVIDGSEAPIWVCQPKDLKNYIVAVGSAAPNSAHDIQFQREEALAAARDAIARKLSVKVKNMFKQFKQATGTGKTQVFDKVTQSVSKQLAYQTLQGTTQLNMWISPKGNMFVLVGLPIDKKFKETLKNIIKSSYNDNNAQYQQSLANKADKELDEAIDKEFNY